MTSMTLHHRLESVEHRFESNRSSDFREVRTRKILSISADSAYSECGHKCNITFSCGRTQDSTCLRMSDEALTVIYKADVIAKTFHAIPTWRAFTTASDKHRIEAFYVAEFVRGFINVTILQLRNFCRSLCVCQSVCPQSVLWKNG